ncbi:MAG: bifunctional homocysteine S-methyltransferase/methylenetetrahydrofolate reductase [Pseudomonadota bacterium]
MRRAFLTELNENGILADGAIGTELYKRGMFLNRCYDELNISQPELIKGIHREYIDAGSHLIETNTFIANRPALSAHGLEDKVRLINLAGAKIAREVAGDDIYVAGSVGPLRWAFKGRNLTDADLDSAYREQIEALAEGGVDAIIFETFTSISELEAAFKAAKKVCNLPMVTQVTLKYLGEGMFTGIDPQMAACKMQAWGADVIGVNCCDGPQGVFEAVKEMAKVTKRPLSAMPNCGLPQVVEGRLRYLATPEYMGEYARRYAQAGVRLIGGCCGTTPDHIREMAKFLKSVRPVTVKTPEKECVGVKEAQPERKRINPSHKSQFGNMLGKKFQISVELYPPLGTDTQKAIDGAKMLKDFGVDAVNIADGPRAMARMNPIAMAVILKQKMDIEVIVHYCCRDRNLLGMQMDLLGAVALNLNNMLFITGDPPKMGNYPNATAVFDIDSISLIRFADNMNNGMDFANRPLGGNTKILIGCGVNPGAVDLDIEVERYKQKVEAGAEFVFSQPSFDVKLLEAFFKKTSDVREIPFFVGVLPLVSLRNAEFLDNEVPGMQVPDQIMKKMKEAKSKEKQLEVGLAVARESLQAAKGMDRVKGAYIMPPFGRYELIKSLIR